MVGLVDFWWVLGIFGDQACRNATFAEGWFTVFTVKARQPFTVALFYSVYTLLQGFAMVFTVFYIITYLANYLHMRVPRGGRSARKAGLGVFVFENLGLGVFII